LLQRKIAFEVNSVPLSDTIIRSLPRRSIMVVSSRAARLPEIEVSEIAARHSGGWCPESFQGLMSEQLIGAS
jgi:hypothetical protein